MADTEALKVAFVCQWYAPEPVTQPMWIVEGLRSCGVGVEVLTGLPNYPTGRLHEGYSPWRPRVEVIDGVRVRRAPLVPSHDRGAIKRMTNYLSWAVSSLLVGWRTLTWADVSLVYSSPATAALGPFVAHKLRRIPYVLHVQDLWPDSVFAAGFLPGRVGRLARGVMNRAVNVLYDNASHIVVISPGMSNLLVSRGVDREKISLVYNWVPKEPESASSSAASGAGPDARMRSRLGIDQRDFVLMYAGNHGDAQGLDSAINGLAKWRETQRDHDRDVHLLLVGDGVAKQSLVSLAGQIASDHVHFVDPVPRHEMKAMMDEADAQLVSLVSDPLFRVTMPSKLQSIMAAGKPVVVCGEGDIAAVVTKSGAGVVCTPGSPQSFVAALEAVRKLTQVELASMGALGRAYYDTHMAPEVGAARLVAHLEAAGGVRE